MSQGLRDTKRRIKSVQSTKKITRAMELIAASRVVKAQHRMEQARPYAVAITEALTELSSHAGREIRHSYLVEKANVNKAAVIVVTSDRGLAGPYSSGVLRQAEELFADLSHKGVEPVVLVTGRKGAAYYRFRERPVRQAWANFSEHPKYRHAKEVADAALELFRTGEVDELYVVYTNFLSSFSQRPTTHRFLPLGIVEVERTHHTAHPLYSYEPDPAAVLDRLLPRYIEERLFSAFLEAAASEQAARRRAMSTATDNAAELIEVYTRQYNRARQAQITQELMEVVGAAEAFSGSE